MSSLVVTRSDEEFELDEFFKSLMFQRIMDGNFSRNERDVLLVVFRKTLHFDKWRDHLAMYWLSKATGVGQQTLRKTINQLEAKGLLEVQRSKGGRTANPDKFHSFEISNDFWNIVFNRWLEIKEENQFYV